MSYPQDEPLNALAKRIHTWAQDNGFYDEPRSFDGTLMLIVSEAAEALEEFRDAMPYDHIYHRDGKPHGIPIELSDILIRVLDTMANYGIDIDAVVDLKMKYNTTRPYKNGRVRL